MHLILHIGTIKTGTTTLQHWMFNNREPLKTKGIWYHSGSNQPALRDPSLCARDPDFERPELVRRNVRNQEDLDTFAKTVRERLTKEVTAARQAGCTTSIVSDEVLHATLITEQEITRLWNLLEGIFDKITIVVHLRPQVDVMVSTASLSARFGERINSDWFEKQCDETRIYDYNSGLARWEAVFGAHNITAVPFKNTSCITSFLIDKLNIDTTGMSPIARKNQALDIGTLALSNALKITSASSGSDHKPHGLLFMDELPVVEKLSIGIQRARDLQAVFTPSNQMLADRWEGLAAADLEPDWQTYDKPSNLEKLEQAAMLAPQFNFILERYLAIQYFERCKGKLQLARLADVQRNEKQTRRFIARCRSLLSRARYHGIIEKDAVALEGAIDQFEASLEKKAPWWRFILRRPD